MPRRPERDNAYRKRVIPSHQLVKEPTVVKLFLKFRRNWDFKVTESAKDVFGFEFRDSVCLFVIVNCLLIY